MAALTHRRGYRDTGSRRLWIVLSLSILIHLPISPLGSWLGLASWVLGAREELPDLGPLTGIPVELIPAEARSELPAAAEPSPASEPAPGPLPEETVAVPRVPDGSREDAGVKPHDAGTDATEFADASPDAGLGDASPDAAASDAQAARDGDASLDAGSGADTDAASAPDAEPPSPVDPIALVADAGAVSKSNANVRLLLENERLRRHPLGEAVGELLTQVYQWRDFFIPSGLDPVRDFDRLLIIGPQLRDSSQLAAFLQYNLEDAQVRSALNGLVNSVTGGRWLDDAHTVASIHADRAERTVVLLERTNVVMVVPPSAAAAAMSDRERRLPAYPGDQVALAFIDKPRQVLGKTLLGLPSSIAWLSIAVYGDEGGGALARVELMDENESLARQHAAELQASINGLTSINLGVLGALLGQRQHRFLEPVTMTARGARIRGSLRATRAQLVTLLELARGFITPEGIRQRRAQQSRHNATGAEAGAPRPVPQPPPGGGAQPQAPSRR